MCDMWWRLSTDTQKDKVIKGAEFVPSIWKDVDFREEQLE